MDTVVNKQASLLPYQQLADAKFTCMLEKSRLKLRPANRNIWGLVDQLVLVMLSSILILDNHKRDNTNCQIYILKMIFFFSD